MKFLECSPLSIASPRARLTLSIVSFLSAAQHHRHERWLHGDRRLLQLLL